jgi:glycosyltransferase involved in cell wall biosynthesis
VNAPLVSCIVPVFNGEPYLRETLDSILAQTHRPLELIVVDDGSTDGSADIIATYGEHIRCHRQENSGPAAARNRGFQAALGSFIASLDADNLWHPEKLRRQVEHFATRPELDVSLTEMQVFWIPELQHEAESYRDPRFGQNLAAHCLSTALIRRNLFDRVGWLDPSLGHADTADWFLRVREQNGVIESVPEVLTYRRMHHSNRSRLMGDDSRDEHLRVVKAHLDRKRRLGIPP